MEMKMKMKLKVNMGETTAIPEVIHKNVRLCLGGFFVIFVSISVQFSVRFVGGSLFLCKIA